MIDAVLSHLARLGGVIVTPRRTLLGVLYDGEGRLYEVLIWMLVVTAALQPVRMGQVLLVGRVAILDGLSAFLNLVASQMLAPLLGALVAATVLHLVDRVRTGGDPDRVRVTFELAVDCCAFMLVPFLILAGIGALLSALGIEAWFLPHRRPTGRGIYLATRLAVAYGPSVVLFGAVFREVLRRGAARPKPSQFDATAER